MKKRIEIFNIDSQQHIGYVLPQDVEDFVNDYRAKGYSVMIDNDNDICIDRSGDDSGLSYAEMIKH